MQKIYNFENCQYNNRHGRYGGMAGDKDGIIFNNENWIIKYPKNAKAFEQEIEVDYTTAPLSEYIGSHIYQILGIDVHETLLGVRNNKIVVACKDFQEHFGDLAEFRTLKNSANKEISEYCKEDVPISLTGDAVNLEEILIHFKVNPFLNKQNIIKRYFIEAIIDVYIDNNDRNNGNVGLLYDNNCNEYKLAPVYDNGNSFNNKMSEEKIIKKLQEEPIKLIEESIGKRTIFVYNKHILSSKKFLNLDLPEIKDAIVDIVPIIKEKQTEIFNFIDNIPEYYNDLLICSKNRKEYYKKGLQARLEHLLEPCYEKTLSNIIKEPSSKETIKNKEKGVTYE